MRQSKAEEKILGERRGNTMCLAVGNVQQPEGQQTSWGNGTFRRNWVPRGGWQSQKGTTPRLTGGERGPGAIAVDKGQGGGDRRCFNCGGFGHTRYSFWASGPFIHLY